ncbi:MAG: nucleotide exchange factor GrpE [Firmicutes bacterium]|nr:nucleotide exchange factor GrpE [Bacillota bacterium]
MSEELEEIEEVEIDAVEALRAESDERLRLAQFYKAEFENFKKRNADAVNKAYVDGKEVAVLQILPIGDSLQEALRTCEHDREGIEVLIRKFAQILGGLGVEEIVSIGQPFDPAVHHAIAVEEGEAPDIVIAEFQKGYKMGGKLLRAAMVKVSK